MKVTNVNELMNFENKIITKMNYSSGGYYKEQQENYKIYQALKRALIKLDLSWFKNKDYKILEDENYHSLNALVQDIKKELKNAKKLEGLKMKGGEDEK